jgi:hypothetical protein
MLKNKQIIKHPKKVSLNAYTMSSRFSKFTKIQWPQILWLDISRTFGSRLTCAQCCEFRTNFVAGSSWDLKEEFMLGKFVGSVSNKTFATVIKCFSLHQVTHQRHRLIDMHKMTHRNYYISSECTLRQKTQFIFFFLVDE